MTVTLQAPLWAGNSRIQRAANNAPPLRLNDSDRAAVSLLQQALNQAGAQLTVDGLFGQRTASAVVATERRFGFVADEGTAGREVLGALDLTLRGWRPPPGAHWGGELARTVLPVARRKIAAALNALADVRNAISQGGFDFVTADGVTMAALQAHFKLVPPGGTKLPREDFIGAATIDPLIANFRGIQRTLANPAMIRHSICTVSRGTGLPNELHGLNVAAEAPFGGPVLFGPPYSDFKLDPVGVTNIDKTGPNSLAAMMMHEATHVIDSLSGDDRTTHISEFTAPYATQPSGDARHNPSAYATFAAHIDEGHDRPPAQRFGLGAGRPL
jgi:peptidoglycan hydrolase-like protein with peptidoglycan-binding domain